MGNLCNGAQDARNADLSRGGANKTFDYTRDFKGSQSDREYFYE